MKLIFWPLQQQKRGSQMLPWPAWSILISGNSIKMIDTESVGGGGGNTQQPIISLPPVLPRWVGDSIIHMFDYFNYLRWSGRVLPWSLSSFQGNSPVAHELLPTTQLYVMVLWDSPRTTVTCSAASVCRLIYGQNCYSIMVQGQKSEEWRILVQFNLFHFVFATNKSLL